MLESTLVCQEEASDGKESASEAGAFGGEAIPNP